MELCYRYQRSIYSKKGEDILIFKNKKGKIILDFKAIDVMNLNL